MVRTQLGTLGGIVGQDSIQFTISGGGQVIASGYNFAEAGVNPAQDGKTPFLISSLENANNTVLTQAVPVRVRTTRPRITSSSAAGTVVESGDTLLVTGSDGNGRDLCDGRSDRARDCRQRSIANVQCFDVHQDRHCGLSQVTTRSASPVHRWTIKPTC